MWYKVQVGCRETKKNRCHLVKVVAIVSQVHSNSPENGNGGL